MAGRTRILYARGTDRHLGVLSKPRIAIVLPRLWAFAGRLTNAGRHIKPDFSAFSVIGGHKALKTPESWQKSAQMRDVRRIGLQRNIVVLLPRVLQLLAPE
ncbi:hypothetical protein FIU97_11380 [Roseivivax sp. THAF40]|nr:hypothetical protein FIU97_11380 [Roseivivax sp. THAF40]